MKVSISNDHGAITRQPVGEMNQTLVSRSWLSEPEYLVEALLDAMPYGALILQPLRDEEGKVFDFNCVGLNAMAADNFGAPAAQLLGSRLNEFLGAVPVGGAADGPPGQSQNPPRS